ncbi:hypothetical protein UlMin_007781 [Ulmus minor]
MEPVTVLRLMLQILLFMMREFVCSNTGAPHHQLVSCLESDKDALLDFKTGLQDPESRLFSWKGNNCCQWEGISCDNRTGAVIEIDLHGPDQYSFSKLGGKISPSITKLKSLRHLDLSHCSFDGIPIPDFFGSLENLQYLDLSNAGFNGTIPPNLGNLSSLQYLDFSSSSVVSNFEWVAGLVSLKHLDMSHVNLSLVGLGWIRILSRLPFLTELHLSYSLLSGSFPCHAFLNFTSLAVLHLRGNNFNSTIPDSLVNVSSLVDVDMSLNLLYGSIPLGLGDLPSLKSLSLYSNKNLTANCSQLFRGKWEKIQFLDLSFNELHGKLPASIGNMKFLTHLDLSRNNVEGGIPSSIGKLCNLEYVCISFNKLDGTLPEFLQGAHNCLSSLQSLDLSKNQLVGKLPEWLGRLRSVETLDLSSNLLYGSIPASLGSLQNLIHLHLGLNRLNGTLPDNLGKLSKLSTFDVFSNQLTGLVTERHFQKLGELEHLDFSSNSFTLNISSNWVPPFQVRNLLMGSCHIGSSFPAWLKFQKALSSLDVSNAGISGATPHWFWEISSQMLYLNISFNKLEGQLPSPFNIGLWADVDLSSNLFEGSIPVLLHTTRLLDLSNNKFFGPIPSNIGNSVALSIIDLSKNNLFGKIPLSLGQLSHLQILHLSDNNLSGEIPETFRHLSSLETLDLGNNRLTGKIPQWIGGGFKRLEILNLRSNSFSGELPSSLSNLSSLRILDVTGNQLNGSIPACFGEFKAMTEVQREMVITYDGGYSGNTDFNIYYRSFLSYYKDKLAVSMKGQFLTITKALSLVVSLDLSGNSLTGEFPPELTKLLGLMVLNFSGNNISGAIPESISNLKQLESLDFSSNRLSGPIPQSLQSLSFLQYLNLSNNDFSGKIPYKDHMTTFEMPSFAGNPRLCGPPLVVTCPGDNKDGNSSRGWTRIDHHDSFVDNWFPLSVGLGFAAGLLVPFLVMALIKSWSDAYFGLVNKVFERISLFTYRMRRAMP